MTPLKHRRIGSLLTALSLGLTLLSSHVTGKERTNDRDFWAFQKPIETPIPEAPKSDWGSNEIDRFVWTKLKANGLKPSPAASKEELIRRVTFDLWGLPPTPEEIDSFVNDPSPDAYANLVDRLLASPHYGEKWGQVWLDVIRYSESEGFEYDRHLPGAWRFRDYVIRSFNDDKPFDQFIKEQIAGDEKESPSQDELIAAGFHRFGPVRRNAGNPEIALSRNEVLTERTDIVGVAFLGLTMGCARCHDHRLDPISQKDYYSLQAFFAGTQERNEFLASPEVVEEWQKKTDALNEEIKALKKKAENAPSGEKEQLHYRAKELEEKLPKDLPTILTIKNDPENRTDIHLLKRGVWEQKGERVPMGFPAVLVPEKAPAYPQEHPKPRTVLADWLVDPGNPLTARVLVNRVWLNHFGSGIVNTPNDFGKHGERPSHPELLDYLATRLVDEGWRLKPIHRQMLLSDTYQQSSRTSASELVQRIDPDNRLYWKFNRRRLMAEEIRDAMLSASGRLNKEMFGPSIMLPVEESMVELLYAPTQWEVTEDRKQHDRRSVYLMAKRNLRLPFMETFDQPTLQSSCGRRESSTHAPQSLELLNGRTANQLADAFVKRLKKEASDSPEAIVERAWRLALGRQPTSEERELSHAFLREQPLKEFALSVFNFNDFLYVH